MQSNYYQVYVGKCFDLAASMIIKSTDSVAGLNQYVTDLLLGVNQNPVDETDPTTWKYYLNISGEYHPIDGEIKITSLDTLETMVFNKANLAIHTSTRDAYSYGSRNYKVLINQYPDQELLIKGILYPVDINAAIAAEDGTILGYPKNLVENNEYSLISRIQHWINSYKIRWTNVQYGVSDALYPATSLGIMYLNLLPAILNARLEACKTNEAHSFHVRQYLASHNLLNKYIDNMTLSQTLFFYRNIAYIERNSGKQAIFKWLIYNLLTVRGLPIVEYLMKHDLSLQPTELYPDVKFYRRLLNNQYSATSSTSISLQEVLANENPLAVGNSRYLNEFGLSIDKQMKNSTNNLLHTKILESSVIDDTNSIPYSLNDILLNHWIYLASTGNYAAYVNIVNPKTNSVMVMNTKDAFILAWYAFCNSIGINPTNIPPMLALRVQRVMPLNSNGSSVVSVDEIMSVVDNKVIDRKYAELALSMQPNIDIIKNTSSFYKLCLDIFAAEQMQNKLVGSQQEIMQRAMMSSMISRIYSDNECNLINGTIAYDGWLKDHNVDISGLTTSELGDFYTKIVNSVTGSDKYSSQSLRDVQSSMLSIMAQLSSYNIQFIPTINNGANNKTDWPVVRVGDVKGKTTSSTHALDKDVGVLDINFNVANELSYPLMERVLFNSVEVKQTVDINTVASILPLELINKPILALNLKFDGSSKFDITSINGVSSPVLKDVYGSSF